MVTWFKNTTTSQTFSLRLRNHNIELNGTMPMVNPEQDIMFKQKNYERESRQQIKKLSACSNGSSINNVVWESQ